MFLLALCHFVGQTNDPGLFCISSFSTLELFSQLFSKESCFLLVEIVFTYKNVGLGIFIITVVLLLLEKLSFSLSSSGSH